MKDDATTAGMPRLAGNIDAIRLVTFDLDDTFWDCLPAINRAESALLEWHKTHTPRITEVHDESSLLAYRNKIRQRFPELAGCVTASRLAGLRSLLSEFGYPESMAEIGFDIFYKVRSQVNLYPGVFELLNDLGKRYKLAAITNGNADLEQIGIARFFDRILSADLHFEAKPSPHMFHDCLKHFGLDGHQVLHVGDNPVTDVLGGLNAGLQTLWFNQNQIDWPEAPPGAHFEVKSVSEIHTLLS